GPPGPPPKPPPGCGFLWLSVMAVVKNTLSPQTMGDDQATPGILAFHCTFFSGPHSVGSAEPVATPLLFCPRNSGQSSACASPGKRAMQTPSPLIHWPSIVLPSF